MRMPHSIRRFSTVARIVASFTWSAGLGTKPNSLQLRWSQPLCHEPNRDLAKEHREPVDLALRRDVRAATRRTVVRRRTSGVVPADHSADSPSVACTNMGGSLGCSLVVTERTVRRLAE